MTDKTQHIPEPELKYSGNFNLYFEDHHQVMFGAASHGGDKDIYIKKIVDRYNALAGIDNPAEFVEKVKKVHSALGLNIDCNTLDFVNAFITKIDELQAEKEGLTKEVNSWKIASEHFRKKELGALKDLLHSGQEIQKLRAEIEKLIAALSEGEKSSKADVGEHVCVFKCATCGNCSGSEEMQNVCE